MRIIRIVKAVKVRRSLPNGTAVHTYWPGDYSIGVDIPEDIALDAIKRGAAKRIRGKGERETKREMA